MVRMCPTIHKDPPLLYDGWIREVRCLYIYKNIQYDVALPKYALKLPTPYSLSLQQYLSWSCTYKDRVHMTFVVNNVRRMLIQLNYEL